ncbi:unnamed protein product, partial [Anisakis simplex]|uniref:Chitin-binding type-2 domain-containing protein n=1 Tax=Anisakis simplex TaxID=6269 RepID=A0A0M3JA31_ANISI
MPEASEEVSTIALEPTHPMLIKPSSTPSTISHMPMFAAPQELCINEPTGSFSFGCSSFYAVCSYGKAHLELCEGNLRFDIESGVCVEEVFVDACTEHLTTEPTTPTTPTTVSSDATSPCPGCPPCI